MKVSDRDVLEAARSLDDEGLVAACRKTWTDIATAEHRASFLRSSVARILAAELMRRWLVDLPLKRVHVVDYGPVRT